MSNKLPKKDRRLVVSMRLSPAEKKAAAAAAKQTKVKLSAFIRSAVLEKCSRIK